MCKPYDRNGAILSMWHSHVWRTASNQDVEADYAGQGRDLGHEFIGGSKMYHHATMNAFPACSLLHVFVLR